MDVDTTRSIDHTAPLRREHKRIPRQRRLFKTSRNGANVQRKDSTPQQYCNTRGRGARVRMLATTCYTLGHAL
eukprot:3192879-Lingulodinium_polyedra.AAC.1